ncbi:hypothetical protein HPB50_026951 [Hyalomma asiaticum]|uniref:Uncharacterized protein n=1 Tax=Hyalomma asiaticum TaxID=266040 RepID=A0ACB7SA94_HYAAI|nr:hypothetical protein HPB50_026951 [Hyalomma asiaticum]
MPRCFPAAIAPAFTAAEALPIYGPALEVREHAIPGTAATVLAAVPRPATVLAATDCAAADAPTTAAQPELTMCTVVAATERAAADVPTNAALPPRPAPAAAVAA